MTDIEVTCVKNFFELLKGLSPQKRKIVLDNIHARFTKVPIIEDTPF